MLEKVYETMLGMLVEDQCVPGVENAFAQGTPCDKLYEEVLEAYSRILRRLDAENEDEDIEVIIDAFLQMQRILCFQMFRYGAMLSGDSWIP